MSTYELDTLSGSLLTQFDWVSEYSGATDIFKFDLERDRNINLSLYNISAGDDLDLSLFEDSNNNGVLDLNDRLVSYSLTDGSVNELIDYNAIAGTYFAMVNVYEYAPGYYGFASYHLDLSATIDLGKIDNSETNRNNWGVSITDPNDVFEFNVEQSGNIKLLLHNLYGGNADLRLFEDSNNNGIFDSKDAEVASSSNLDDKAETIKYFADAGTYFAEVSRHSGTLSTVAYDLSLSHSTLDSAPSTYQAFDANQVFSLSSNADADHTIYLDFNGHWTLDTQWNELLDDPFIVTSAYDTDGDSATFSTSELEDIWEIWQRVSEDFIPFDVNVTTALPSSDQLQRSGSSDTEWGVRVSVGGDGYWLDDAGGGVALLNSFNSDTDTPTFVFSENLGSARTVAEAVSHEVGHTLGLYHDGYQDSQTFLEYYDGYPNLWGLPPAWAPIMGNSYSSGLSQWDSGEYFGAINIAGGEIVSGRQGDLDVITGQNGFGYRADDHSDFIEKSTAIDVDDDLTTYGIIEKNDDVDWFSLSLKTGELSLFIDPFEQGANLDILASVYDDEGNHIVTDNNQTSLGAGFTGTIEGGQYYLSVTGTGQGNPLFGGYSDYGSLGQYSIEVSVV